MSPSGSAAAEDLDRHDAASPEGAWDAVELPSVDPADSDEATAAVATEQGGAPTAEGAPGDDPDAGADSAMAETFVPTVVWATPMGTPPVYPATEELEQPMPEVLGGDGSWQDAPGERVEAASDPDDTSLGRGETAAPAAAAVGGVGLAVDHGRPREAGTHRAGGTADADLLERLAARIRAGAPLAVGGARQEAVVLARLLAELLADDDAGSTSRQAPPASAGVEL